MRHLAVTLVVTGLALTAAASARSDILEQVLVKVNGEIITKTDLEQRQVAALRQRDPAFRPKDDAELQQVLAEITPQVIVEAVDELLLVQRGKELGYTMTTDQFNSIVENIKKENKIESDEQLQAALKAEGMTMADLRRQLERQMLITRVQQAEVMPKLQVTETEIRAYYDQHKGEFTTTPQVTLREMLFAVPVTAKGVNVAQDDEAREKAEMVRKRLLAGEAFQRLAADFSDSPSKANGGLVGPIDLTALAPELLKAIQGMKAGDLTPVLRTERGYQLIRIESISTSTQKTFEEARGDIADKIADEKRRAEFRRYLNRLRADAIIDWKNEEVKKAYEIGLKQQADAG